MNPMITKQNCIEQLKITAHTLTTLFQDASSVEEQNRIYFAIENIENAIKALEE